MDDRLCSIKSDPTFVKWLIDSSNIVMQNDATASAAMIIFHQGNPSEELMTSFDIKVDERFPKLCMGSKPPKFRQLKQLTRVEDFPSAWQKKHLLVYGLGMEKKGRRPRFQVGSAKSYQKGAYSRMSEYAAEYIAKYPIRVRDSIKEGFQITFIVVLAAIPRVLEDYSVRMGTTLLLEGNLT